MPNYVISAADDAVVLRNYEGMLVRYQAEDRPNTTQRTATRGVSALLDGSKSVLMPENSERMARRRELNVITNSTAEEERGCSHEGGCGGVPTSHEPLYHPVNVLTNGCGS
jgi:lysine 2,3-aminomutase